MLRQHHEYLGDEDLAILKLESPTIAGHTCKVITVEPGPSGRISLAQLQESIAARLGREPRMLQKLSSGHGRLHWVDDESFDIADHVKQYPLDRPADRRGLLDVVATLMTTRLDRSRPLWAIHLVDLEDDRVALVCLIHHCMADGMAVVRLSGEVIWDSAQPVAQAPAPKPHTAPESNGKTHLRKCIHRELMPGGIDTPLDRHPTAERKVAVAVSSISEIKGIGHSAAGRATVNDVVLCAVAGGLRVWLEHHGGSLEGVRIKVPVSLHDHDERSDALGNHDSFMVIDVGTDESDPHRRLVSIAAQTRELKQSHDAQTLGRLFEEMRHVSGIASNAMAKWSNSPHVFTINVSNVPGPREPITVLEAPVVEIFTLAEIGERHALRVSVISNGDQLTFGLCSDAAAVADPESVAAGIETDLATLSRAKAA